MIKKHEPTRNYEYVYENGVEERRVVRGWVEDGENLTLYGNHNVIICIKEDDLAWSGETDSVVASLQWPFDRVGFPVAMGPLLWNDIADTIQIDLSVNWAFEE